MTRRACSLRLIGLLATLPLCAPVVAAKAVSAGGAAQRAEVMLVRQKAAVRHLQKSVRVQESDSRAAAAKLQRQDAEIAELQRQLQAAQQPGKGR